MLRLFIKVSNENVASKHSFGILGETALVKAMKWEIAGTLLFLDAASGHAVNQAIFGMFGQEMDTRELIRDEILDRLANAGLIPDETQAKTPRWQQLSRFGARMIDNIAMQASSATCATLDTVILTPIVSSIIEAMGFPESAKLLTPPIVFMIIANAQKAQHATIEYSRRELRQQAVRKVASNLQVPELVANGLVLAIEDVLRRMARLCFSFWKQKVETPIKKSSRKQQLHKIFEQTSSDERVYRVLSDALQFTKEDPILLERMTSLQEPLASYCGSLDGPQLAQCSMERVETIFGIDMAKALAPLVESVSVNEYVDREMVKLLKKTDEMLGKNDKLQYDAEA